MTCMWLYKKCVRAIFPKKRNEINWCVKRCVFEFCKKCIYTTLALTTKVGKG